MQNLVYLNDHLIVYFHSVNLIASCFSLFVVGKRCIRHLLVGVRLLAQTHVPFFFFFFFFFKGSRVMVTSFPFYIYLAYILFSLRTMPHFISLYYTSPCHILCSISHVHASTCTFFHVTYSTLLVLAWLLHALIYCLYGMGLLNKCCCRINLKVIKMKANYKA
jgi:hypothetical protein